MNKVLKYLGGDRVIWIITFLLLAFSLVSVYSFVPILVKIEGGTPFKYLFKHFIYVIIGLGVMFWVHRTNPKYFSQLAKFGFYLAVVLLIFTFFFGMKVNDAGRWVKIPFVGLTFQSSDFAKLALVLYVSRLLMKKKDVLNDWRNGFWPVVIPIVIICGLIVKDNFSTAAILFAISLALLFLGRVPILKILSLIGGGIALFMFIVLIHISAPDLKLLPRWETWVNRYQNKIADDGSAQDNAQAMNSELAIYNGRVNWVGDWDQISIFGGQGVGDGQLKEYLPEAYADFFYASFVEEFGPIIAGVLLLLYLILLFRIMRIGLNADSLFETYLCIGIGVIILSQAAVNMLVCTGLFPVTGQNMPLLAMGGSAMIMTCLGLGMVQSIANKQIRPKTEEQANTSDEELEEEEILENV
ncbi:FtsW/RodA/SpoVE family cell cycle protein [Crocinitomicaceae bacterium]|nr:FtsW/RodA/SpoVE family cell cycle protein [Crocinitomicaceae bacterium]